MDITRQPELTCGMVHTIYTHIFFLERDHVNAGYNEFSFTCNGMYIYRLIPQSCRLLQKMLYMSLPISHISLYSQHPKYNTMHNKKKLTILVHLANWSTL